MLKKKFYKIYIIKLYDIKKSHLKKKIKFNIFLGIESKLNKNYLNIIHTKSNIIFKNINDIIKTDKEISFKFSIEKTNPYLLSVKKLEF